LCLSSGAPKRIVLAGVCGEKNSVTKLLPLGKSMHRETLYGFAQTVIFRRWLIWFLGGGPQVAI
jgi:hypothetical protein